MRWFEELRARGAHCSASSGCKCNRTQSLCGGRQRENSASLYCFKIGDSEETEGERGVGEKRSMGGTCMVWVRV